MPRRIFETKTIYISISTALMGGNMKKTLLVVVSTISVLAGTAYAYMEGGCHSRYGGEVMFWMGLAALVYFTIASIIFSIIFWLTYNWIAKKR